MPCFRKNINTNAYFKDTTEIIVASWKKNTKKKYYVYIKQQEMFCKNKNIKYVKTMFRFFNTFI